MREKTVTRADSGLSGKLISLVASERDLEVRRESRAVRHRTYGSSKIARDGNGAEQSVSF